MKTILRLIILTFVLAAMPSYALEQARLRDLEVGQEYSFKIAWNGIPVGTVATKVEGMTVVQGRKAYQVSLNVKTNKWASLIYPVDDTFMTYIDYETSCSLHHEVIRSEGRYRKKAIIEYIYGRFLANYHYVKQDTKKTVDVAGDIHDPLSAAYYFLRKDYLKAGDEISLNIDLNEKHYRLLAKIEKGRPINIPRIGAYETMIVRPYVERKGKPYKRGNGFAYISTGDERLPLYAVVAVLIWGRFTATLSSFISH